MVKPLLSYPLLPQRCRLMSPLGRTDPSLEG
ncbi:hypothetical protein [Enterococcus phage PEF1]